MSTFEVFERAKSGTCFGQNVSGHDRCLVVATEKPSLTSRSTSTSGLHRCSSLKKHQKCLLITALAILHLSALQIAAQQEQQQELVTQTTTTTTTTTAAFNSNAHLAWRRQHEPVVEPDQRHFVYHLNHLRPPSLIPLTIEQQQQHLQTRASDDNQRLLQLQLPLQLHLKLRPLPLPQPPPPQPPERREDFQLPVAEKRKRSLRLDGLLANELGVHQFPIANPMLQRQPTNSHQDAWREAKRALLSSVMSPLARSTHSLVNGAAVERRSQSAKAEAEASDEARSKKLARSLQWAPLDFKALLAPMGSFSRASSPQPTTPVPNLVQTQTSSEVQREDTRSVSLQQQEEPRRQRHSAQQQQDQSQSQVQQGQVFEKNRRDDSFQALAASLLPFFWPSYQLAPFKSSPPSTAPQVEPPLPVTSAPHQDSRQRSQEPRLPSYLELGPSVSKRQIAGELPPDSTRLANKYPMPKIKFQTDHVDLDGISGGKLAKVQAAVKISNSNDEKPPLPRQLSKLIERQLLANASDLLLHYKRQLRHSGPTPSSMAPTVSVTRVVGPSGETSASSPSSTSTTTSTTTRRPTTITTSRRPTTTTEMPTTTTTTTPALAPTIKATTITTTEDNKVLPEFELDAGAETEAEAEPEEEKVTSTTTRAPISTKAKTNKPASKKAKPLQSRSEITQKQKANKSAAAAGVKLFHFRRKPDMNKLPFYKRPLNYTDLGWTPEQIQEHQELVASQADQIQSLGQEEFDQSGSDISSESLSAASRQKRKRRNGRNHFERLLAELHAATTTTEAPPTSISSAPTPARKLSEKEKIGETTMENRSNNGSKPIIRMRRKHHGDQPLGAWRPSKPLLTAPNEKSPSFSFSLGSSAQAQTRQLLLVPSGLLTPSGHQLVPVFGHQPKDQGEASEQRRLMSDFLAWRPARQTANQTLAPSLAPDFGQNRKPSDGLAPSGEEAYLQAPAPASVSRQESPLALNNNSEGLRVPKLLVKPMRPAKYSLNGYIPKPSLGDQPQLPAWQQQTRAKLERQVRPQKRQARLSPISGKDLDLATSNEVFSRRRGLQQHQRSSGVSSNEALDSLNVPNGLVEATQAGNGTGTGVNLIVSQGTAGESEEKAQRLRQMEENKRKYIVQRQELQKGPKQLSAHRISMIKAKLSLISPPSSLVVKGSNSKDANSVSSQENIQPQASTNLASLRAPEEQQQKAAEAVETNQQARNANQQQPLNAIPKTDFECTDSKGRFVAGLFADRKTGCQVWHLCSNNRKYSFLCPTGTIFNEKVRICDWRYNAKCEP